MKWHSNLFQPIPLVRNSVNFIVFECMQQQFRFRELLSNWLQNQQMEYPYFLFTIEGIEVTTKDLNLLMFSGGDLSYFKSKEEVKQLTQLVKFEIENTPYLLDIYATLLRDITKAFEQMTVIFQQFEIEFATEAVSFEQLLKLVQVNVSRETGEPLSILEYREFLLDSWLHLVHNKNTNVCIFNFPENELDQKECKQLFTRLNEQDCTMICLTSNPFLLELVEHKNIHLIKATGSRYEIELLFEDLKLFQLDAPCGIEELTKKLAIQDFFHDTALLDETWRTFLSSNRF